MYTRNMPLLGYLRRHKYAVVMAVLALWALVRSLHSLKDRVDTSRVDGLHVEDRPRYLYHSAFRENHDTEYENRLRNALRYIESQQLSLYTDNSAPNTLWQILLRPGPIAEQRGDDSFRFEEENSEWTYKVSFAGATLAWIRPPWQYWHSR